MDIIFMAIVNDNNHSEKEENEDLVTISTTLIIIKYNFFLKL